MRVQPKRRGLLIVGVLCVLATLFVSSAEAQGGTVFYVDDDAPPGGDGQSWDTAYGFLQDALTPPALPGDEIRVAQGVYKPDRSEANPNGTGSRNISFQLSCVTAGILR